MFSKLVNFFKESRLEFKKITWPSRQETVKHSLLVIGVSLGVALFLGAMDFIFVWLLNRFVI
ncbi:MAG: Preprotein translocase, SecE subunit [Parcubacteria group bacterium GW2011_GWC1_43_12]|nr:MAG: Preprotein translocase, SecE subunit [Parcubacteria group bacterium GW2011_GWC1_43_12]